MDHYDVKRLALVLAVQAEIEGMKVENLARDQLNESHAFGIGDFNNKAGDLENLAHAHNDQL